MAGVDRPRHGAEERILVLAPTARDAATTRDLLADAGMTCALCPDLAELCREIEASAAAAVLTEEALVADVGGRLAATLDRQPPWSDLPLLVLTGGGADSPAALHALESLGNVTLLERPVRVATLVSAVRAALRARRRQYQTREHLAEQHRAAEALREADRRKDEFLAMLAHELRNPLAPIRNGLHILSLVPGSDEELAEVRRMMERQLLHMVRLVDDLLDVSRITQNKIELRWEAVDLAAVVARSVEAVGHLLAERQHRLEVSLPGEPLPLVADAARLEQILSNLLSNAAKYSEPGGRVELSVRSEGGEAVVSVRDSGIGIRADMLPRVFDLFQQADRLPGRVSEGLGLGLTLVKRLAEMHGGSAEAHSAGPGQGSEFIIRLPLASGAGGTAGPRGATTTTREGAGVRPRRVLVVDDNVDGARSLALLLRLDGHEVRVAHDGPSALEVAALFRPDVVLLDIGLPKGMDGYRVARALRELPGLGETLLVALTGYGQEEDRRRTAAAGFQAHLVKPASLAALRELLARTHP